MSFSDILERLKISKGSLSQGLQLLRSFGAVRLSERSRNQKHSLSRATPLRRDYFEPELAVKRRTKSAGGALIFTSEERLTRLHELAGQVGIDIFLSARINWRHGGLTSFCCAHWDARFKKSKVDNKIAGIHYQERDQLLSWEAMGRSSVQLFKFGWDLLELLRKRNGGTIGVRSKEKLQGVGDLCEM